MRSILVPLSQGIGVMILLTPRIKRILKIFDPMIFPRARSVFFLYAAMIEVASSGSEVPIAIIVSPITLSESPKYLAMSVAPLTIRSPPKISPQSQRAIRRQDFQRGKILISPFSCSRVSHLLILRYT